MQGDREASIGLPVSPMCNRATMNMPRAQLGFINIFLKVRMSCALTRLAMRHAAGTHRLLGLKNEESFTGPLCTSIRDGIAQQCIAVGAFRELVSLRVSGVATLVHACIW